MPLSHVQNVRSLEEISVCPSTGNSDLCQLRVVQGKTPGTGTLTCYQGAYSLFQPDYLRSWDPSLAEYNAFVGALTANGYTQVCRTDKQISPGRYGIFAIDPIASIASILGLKGPQPAPGTAPYAQPQTTGAIQPCNPMVDVYKKTMPLKIDQATAAYLASKFAFAGDGCSGTNGYYKFTTDPGSLDVAIAAMRSDMNEGKLPSNVPKEHVRTLIAALEDIKDQDPIRVQRKMANDQMDMMKIMITVQIGAGVAQIGVMSYLIYQQNKVAKQQIQISTQMLELQKQGLELQKKMIDDKTGNIEDALERFGRDLNAEHRAGRLEPMDLGLRNSEIQQTRIALMQNRSVVYTGHAGVGKTAVAEGLAMGIEQGLYPELKDSRIVMLDLTSMEAGSKWRGSYEDRLKAILDEVRASQNNGKRVILFIDEIHRLMGSGAAEKVEGAAQALKTPLARGEITIIGATTINEYHQHIASDPALAQRFTNVDVRPMTAAETVLALVSKLNKLGAPQRGFPQMEIPTETLYEIVDLTERYLPGEAFPRKADNFLREAVAYKRLQCASDPSKATALTSEDVQRYFELKYKNRFPRDPNEPPPTAPATDSAPQGAPEPAPDGSGNAMSMADIPPLAANMPLYIGEPLPFPVSVVVEPAPVYASPIGPVEIAPPEGYLFRVVTTEEIAVSTERSTRVTPPEMRTVSGGTSFASTAAFNVGTGIAAWGGIHYVMEPVLGRELSGTEKFGVYTGTGVAGSIGFAYLAGSSIQWTALAASVPVGFASFMPVGYSVAQSEDMLGIDPLSPAGELIIIGGGGVLAAAGATATLPVTFTTAAGVTVTTAAEAGITTLGIGLGIATGLAVGGAFLGGVLIGRWLNDAIK